MTPKARLSYFRELDGYRAKIQEQLVIASKLSDIESQISDVESKIEKLVQSGILSATARRSLRAPIRKAKRRVAKAGKIALKPAPV